MSPIAENALLNYRYKLVSSSRVDEQTVYKIQVIPLRKEDPTWAGFIYIVDNQWNIYATDLFVTGKTMQMDFVDTIQLQQNFVQINKDVWRIFSQRLDFKFKLLSFKFKGFFNGVFSNYNLTPQYPPNFFGNELFTALNATKTNDIKQWETLRPIPLTAEEMKDYQRKDSIQTVHRSKPYMDSMMHKANRFKIINLLSGYTYRNSYKNTQIGFGSVLNAVNFNAIQGLNLTLPFNYAKEFKDSLFAPTLRRLTVAPSLNYSFAEEKIRGELNANYLFNYFNRANISLNFGQKVQQFNQNNIISPLNTLYQALYNKRHIYFAYQKTFAKMSFWREITNGLTGNISLEAAQRDPLSISTQYSFNKKDANYELNIPRGSTISNLSSGKAVIADLTLTWTPRQKYTTYPHGKFNETPIYPVFKARFQKAFGNNTSQFADYEKIILGVKQESISAGLVGYSEINAEFGAFLSKKQVLFADYTHFNGNVFSVVNKLHFMEGFFTLPYYQFSTTNTYFMAHGQHHFEGFLLGKIPFIRKLGFKEIARVAYLNTPQLGNYAEAGFGIDNIGYGLFRLLRVDCSWTYRNGKIEKKPMWLFGLNIPLNN